MVKRSAVNHRDAWNQCIKMIFLNTNLQIYNKIAFRTFRGNVNGTAGLSSYLNNQPDVLHRARIPNLMKFTASGSHASAPLCFLFTLVAPGSSERTHTHTHTRFWSYLYANYTRVKKNQTVAIVLLSSPSRVKVVDVCLHRYAGQESHFWYGQANHDDKYPRLGFSISGAKISSSIMAVYNFGKFGDYMQTNGEEFLRVFSLFLPKVLWRVSTSSSRTRNSFGERSLPWCSAGVDYENVDDEHQDQLDSGCATIPNVPDVPQNSAF